MSVRRRPYVVLVAIGTAVAAALVGAAPPALAVNAFPKVPGGTPCCVWSFLRPGQALLPEGPGPVHQSQLESVGLAASASATYAPTALGAYLVLQTDGNLVEYASDSGEVLFTTHTTTGVKLVFQGDHNVVLYDRTGRPLWQTRTSGTDAVYFGPYGNGQLVTQRADGQFVSTVGKATTRAPGTVVQSANSPNGQYVLQVQSDGNVVEYHSTDNGRTQVAVWNTHTAGRGPVRLAAQLDGNLVVYSRTTGAALWSSGTASGTTAYRQLDLRDDGSLVLWSTDGVHRTRQLWTNGLSA